MRLVRPRPGRRALPTGALPTGALPAGALPAGRLPAGRRRSGVRLVGGRDECPTAQLAPQLADLTIELGERGRIVHHDVRDRQSLLPARLRGHPRLRLLAAQAAVPDEPVELNPRRAKIVGRPEDFEFSSARAHVTGERDPRVSLAEVPARQQFTQLQWREFLGRTDLARDTALRQALPLSRPCGNTSWIRGLEARFHRKLAWSPPGRPNATNYSTAN